MCMYVVPGECTIYIYIYIYIVHVHVHVHHIRFPLLCPNTVMTSVKPRELNSTCALSVMSSVTSGT